MDRRATIATLMGRSNEKQSEVTSAAATAVGGLTPFSGTFDRQAAAHLLRRVTFGPTRAQILQAEADGLAATIAKIFTPPPVTDEPINHRFANDPNCTIGEVWVDKPYTFDNEIQAYRTESLVAWTGFQLVKKNISIQEKLTLFWHNHFVTGDLDDPKFIYDYAKLLRSQGLGNFRQFTKEITINAAMLRYLNGNQNVNTSPNENFARELVELFTVGKGDLVGPGDYTNYTEDDIQAMARILTGWTDRGWFALDDTPVGSAFISSKHDNGSKQLSHRFGNAVINGAGSLEYSNLIDVIFQQPACAQYICTKFYRFFVSDHIDDDIQVNVIDPLAQLMINYDYEIQPVLEALFQSEHFFSDGALGCVIKNPMDFTLGIIKQFETKMTDDMFGLHRQSIAILYATNFLGMSYYNPPNVAGWKAYYQEPAFHQIWINAVTLPQRMGYAYGAIVQGFEISDGDPDVQIDIDPLELDPLVFVDQLEEPGNPNVVVEEFALTLLPRPLSIEQLNYLKTVLIPGLPDFEWEVEYLEYAIDPENENLAIPVRQKLKNMLTVLVTMGEFQLM